MLRGPQDLTAFDRLHAAIAEFFLPDSSPPKTRRNLHRPKQLSHGSMPASPSLQNLLLEIRPADGSPGASEHRCASAEAGGHFFGSPPLTRRRHQPGFPHSRRERPDQIG